MWVHLPFSIEDGLFRDGGSESECISTAFVSIPTSECITLTLGCGGGCSCKIISLQEYRRCERGTVSVLLKYQPVTLGSVDPKRNIITDHNLGVILDNRAISNYVRTKICGCIVRIDIPTLKVLILTRCVVSVNVVLDAVLSSEPSLDIHNDMIFRRILVEYTDYLINACVVIQNRTASLIRVDECIIKQVSDVGANLFYGLQSGRVRMRMIRCPSAEHLIVGQIASTRIIEHSGVHIIICGIGFLNVDRNFCTICLMENDLNTGILTLVHHNIDREGRSDGFNGARVCEAADDAFLAAVIADMPEVKHCAFRESGRIVVNGKFHCRALFRLDLFFSQIGEGNISGGNCRILRDPEHGTCGSITQRFYVNRSSVRENACFRFNRSGNIPVRSFNRLFVCGQEIRADGQVFGYNGIFSYFVLILILPAVEVKAVSITRPVRHFVTDLGVAADLFGFPSARAFRAVLRNGVFIVCKGYFEAAELVGTLNRVGTESRVIKGYTGDFTVFVGGEAGFVYLGAVFLHEGRLGAFVNFNAFIKADFHGNGAVARIPKFAFHIQRERCCILAVVFPDAEDLAAFRQAAFAEAKDPFRRRKIDGTEFGFAFQLLRHTRIILRVQRYISVGSKAVACFADTVVVLVVPAVEVGMRFISRFPEFHR